MDSSYYPRGRAERLIAGGRLILAVFSLLAIWVDPSEPAKYARLAYSLLNGYVVYAVVLALVVWRLPKPLGRLPLTTHVLDLIVFLLFMYFTEGPNSPFFAYFVFSIVCATLRWQWRGTLWTAAAALAAFIGLGAYASEVLHDQAFELNSFIIRSVYLGVVATLLGYLGIYQERRRSEISMLAAWPRAVPLEARTLVRSMLEHARCILHAPRVILAWEQEEEPWFHLGSCSLDDFNYTCEPPATFQPLVAEELDGNDFLCPDVRTPVPTVLHTSSAGFERWQGAPLNPDLQARFAIETVLSLKLCGESLKGRLFFLDKQGLISDDLLLGQIVAREVVARLDLFYLVERLKQAAAAEERLHVSHDLHDGVLQSLAAVTMRLDMLPHLLDEDPPRAKEQLLEIDRLLRGEQHSLRSFIWELKSASRGLSQEEVSLITRLEGLVKQVEGQWDLRVGLTTAGLDGQVPETLGRNIYYLVREALLNAARHSGASSVGVELRTEDHEVRITVADNGRGFEFRGHYDHATLMERKLGPVTLKGRITSLGGTLAIESSEAGARLDITFPRPGA